MTRPDHHPDAIPPDRLDTLVRDWRRRQDVRSDTTALASRVAAAVRADDGLGSPEVRQRPHGRWPERTAWFTAGIAAAVAVAVLLRSADRDDTAADWPPSVKFAAAQVAEKAAVAAGMEETFADGFAWVAEHDSRIDVGLAPGEPPVRGTPLAVRIVVLSRREGDAEWRPIWQSDVVARSEQVVDVAAGTAGNGRLRLWMHELSDGAIAVEGDLALAETLPPVTASFGSVQRPGEPQRVTGRRTIDIEWQVIQTVVPLVPRDATHGKVG
jgi:hypothetical protein